MCLGNCQRVSSSLQDMYRMYILVISIDFDTIWEKMNLPFYLLCTFSSGEGIEKVQ